ncbi:hypothetical protein AMECASPLE_017801 [Ameca splendens]|uniref:Uncharacterized protein n=1 Tax=Ameca splendens TaxID=208324 RepID=A0ABV0Z0W9_9TELE
MCNVPKEWKYKTILRIFGFTRMFKHTAIIFKHSSRMCLKASFVPGNQPNQMTPALSAKNGGQILCQNDHSYKNHRNFYPNISGGVCIYLSLFVYFCFCVD